MAQFVSIVKFVQFGQGLFLDILFVHRTQIHVY